MSATASLMAARFRNPLALRFAARELRGGLRGFSVFVVCIAVGVMAIAGVRSLASGLAEGLAREGRVILGGDIAFTLSLREASESERAFLERHGPISAAATLRAMARREDGRTALVEVKAVDSTYPLYGEVKTDSRQPLAMLLAMRDGAFGAAVDPALLIRLNLAPGARIMLGSTPIEIRAALVSEPDKLAGGIGFGPRLLISEAALRASGLLQPGSIVRWHYRLRLDENEGSDADLRTVAEAAKTQLPEAGWDVRSRNNASPALEQNIDRFTQYLTLVGLAALLVGGIGAANAVNGHLERRRDAIATLKALGATGSRVFAIYLTQVLAIAGLAALPGLALGAALPFAIVDLLQAVLPLPIAPAFHASDLGIALVYGLLSTAVFALWPLGCAHDVQVSALFRGEIANSRNWPRPRYIVATALAACALALVAVSTAYDKRIAAIFVIGAVVILALLRVIATLFMAAARRVPRPGSPVLRLALANLHRPGALTPSVVLSLGLGVALLATVITIDGNLRRQFLAALPEKAPAFYFLDIPAGEAENFAAFIRAQAPGASLERVPMLRGRIVAANGIAAENLKPPAEAAWALQSDRGITYADQVPTGSRLLEGEWWKPGYRGAPLVSFEKRIADGLGLKLGDPLIVNVLGRNITAKVANLRSVDWQSLGMNFVMVFSPNSFAGAPHTDIATLTFKEGSPASEEVALLSALADAFPAVTTIRVREALDAVGQIVTNLVLAIRAATIITLLIAVLVLGAALAAGHRHRVYDAVILKTLGATRIQLLTAYVLEYVALGLATALFAVAAGTGAAAFVIVKMMNLSFTVLLGASLVTALGAVVVTVILGLIGTLIALGQRPSPVLRNL